MIKITYCTRDRPGERPTLALDGHAGYAEYGKDIVCASVSVLFQTLANALAEYTVDDVSVRIAPGDSHITWNAEQSGTARIITMAFLDGMQAVADEYPQNVTLEID